MVAEPSPARRGLDALLAAYPIHDLASAETEIPVGENRGWTPWLVVELFLDGEFKQFAIWKATGAVHTIGADGAVSDGPTIDGFL